jgi:hypothetical protein
MWMGAIREHRPIVTDEGAGSARGSVAAMAGRSLGRLTAKVMQSAKPSAVRERATAFGRLLKEEYEAGKRGDPAPTPAEDAATAEEVADAMHKVDWAKVKAATASRTADATQGMKSMAAQVDWAKVQPVAAQVSTALIAAVASGQIPLGGHLGGRVVRTIMNDRDLAQKVASTLARTPGQMPPDFRGVIETTGREQT